MRLALERNGFLLQRFNKQRSNKSLVLSAEVLLIREGAGSVPGDLQDPTLFYRVLVSLLLAIPTSSENACQSPN